MSENRTSIHLKADSAQIEIVRNGRRSIKNTNIQAIQEVLTRGDKMQTPLLPGAYGVQRYTKLNNREQYVMTTPSFKIRAKYDLRAESRDSSIQEFDIITPATMWVIHVVNDPATNRRRYEHGAAYAIKNPILTMNDLVYVFPFSNTSSNYLCWGSGSQDFPVLAGSKSLQTIPDRFFANPFNSDLDGNKYEPFRDMVNGQNIIRERTIHLLQYLDIICHEAAEKNEEPVFPNHILRPYETVQDVLDSLDRSHMN